ncbi:MAG: glycosyltransferase, partial [Anaerolineales bacterium]
ALFRSLDGVVCLDAAMQNLLQSRYAPASRQIEWDVIPNWEPRDRFPARAHVDPWIEYARPELSGRMVILYMGNAGAGHRFETVLKAARDLSADPIAFVFVGGGSKWPILQAEAQATELVNMFFYNYIPDELLLPVMAGASCALITLHDHALGVISPSKMHAYLAMGLPLVYIGPEGSNVDVAIQRFDLGISLRQSDSYSLAAFIRRLQTEPALLQAYRQRARTAFEAAYSDRIGLDAFDSFIARFAQQD